MAKLKKCIIIFQFFILFSTIFIFNPITCQIYTLHYANKYGLCNTIFYRQIKSESFFRCFVKSPKGAIGIGQILYTTAVYVEPEIKRWELYLPWRNLDISGKYMQILLSRYKDNYSLALAAYNWGETNVNEKLKEKDISIENEINYSYLFENIRETYTYLEIIMR